MFVQVVHAYGPGAWDDRGKSGEAEAAFVERGFVVPCQSDLRIDDHVERYGPTIFLREFLGREIPQEFFASASKVE